VHPSQSAECRAVASAAVCRQVYFCSQAGDPGAHHAPAHAKEAKQPVDPNGAAAGADVNASGVAAGGSGAASSPDGAASTASVTAARVGAEQASAAAADDLEVVVTEPIKGGGADKVLTPPSEPAVPSADTSADAAAIEAAIIAASDALEPLSHRIREARANPFRDPERAHDSETIEEIAAACRKAGREWKDPSFGHADEEVFKNWPVGLDKSAVSWEPPSRYCSTRRPVGKNKHGKRTWLYCDFNGDGALGMASLASAPACFVASAACMQLTVPYVIATSRCGDGSRVDERLRDRAGFAGRLLPSVRSRHGCQGFASRR
jgi:hypothetical protein